MYLVISSRMTSFFSWMGVFLETLSQCSYPRLTIDLGTAVKIEMSSTLELLFKCYFKLWSVFWNLQLEQSVLIHQQKH